MYHLHHTQMHVMHACCDINIYIPRAVLCLINITTSCIANNVSAASEAN